MPDPLDDLVESVSDGRDVDWARAERAARDAGERARTGALHDVARIAAFNRGLQRVPAPGPRPDEPPTERWGPLTLLELVGTGASGRVWRAWDATLQREVALKFLAPDTPDAAVRLTDEARALARVRHPGVVAVQGVAEHDGRAGLWMDYLRGESLAERLERDGPLPPAEVARLGAALCHALAAVHEAGVVHGDLKPANVHLEDDDRPVLTDFGLGTRRALASEEARRASGTPVFMAPELLAGGAATPRSDLYALGVTLRWALTGRAPFAARNLDELIRAAGRGPDARLAAERPDAPPALVAALDRAMAPLPTGRFARADEFAEALEAALPAEPPMAPPGSPAARRRRALLAGLAGAALMAAVWLALRRPAPPVAQPDPRAGGTVAAEVQTRGTATGADAAGGTVGAPGPSATAAPTYEVQATLVGRTGGAYRRLAPGDRVAPGDFLSLEFSATRPAWVYVLNEDERGETYLLFPQPLFDRTNPIAPDSALVLPGPIGGHENAWQVTSRGGREHFLVVASAAPIAEIEREFNRLPEARPGRPIRYARVEAPVLERLRGVGGVAPLPADTTPRRAGAFERFQALAGRETVRDSVWVRSITLENPLR